MAVYVATVMATFVTEAAMMTMVMMFMQHKSHPVLQYACKHNIKSILYTGLHNMLSFNHHFSYKNEN